MTENFEPAALDEGVVVFVKGDDDDVLIQGTNLIEGETVEVVSKKGKKLTVVVSEIVNDDSGLQTARFDWENNPDDLFKEGGIFFHQADNGAWLIRGQGLIPGDEVTVQTKNGAQKTVTVGRIVDTNSDGIQTAEFNDEPDMYSLFENGTIIFTKNDDGQYVITGKGLKEGSTVRVTKKSGKKVKVVVEEIIEDEDGIQTAAFSWLEQDNKKEG